jgi:hypothetical protein
MIEKPDFVGEEELEEMLDYLDALQDSGRTNMFGAAPYLRAHWPLTKEQARTILSYWMKTYDMRHDDEETGDEPLL